MMKKNKRVLSIFLTAFLCAVLATPLFSCGGMGGGTDDGGETDKSGKANVITASLLDGKVANLMSANGIAIQDKTQVVEPISGVLAKMKSVRRIVASADDSTAVVEQSKTELVKETEEGVQDVRFHDGEKGDYTKWNNAYETHHHDGEICEVENCAEISDEILAEEEEVPTVISLDARVNKLYNVGKFTFLCVSSAVEGQVKLFSLTGTSMSLPMHFFAEQGAYLNTEDHYKSEEDRSRIVSYMKVSAGDKNGVILVKRSDAETGYHYANYWSDDFNQSYIIDNETGKTYSLSMFPHIYSVQNGVILTKTDKGQRLYRPQIDENGELDLNEIVISEELQSKYPIQGHLTDIHGNVVFRSNQYIQGSDIYGEVREGGFIFTGINQEVYNRLRNGENRQYSAVKARAYANAKRYLVGNDGQIYRFDFRGEFDSVPVHVLNTQGKWVSVPDTAHVVFSDADSYFADITCNSKHQYLLITQIKNGKTYFSNSLLGMDYVWTMNTLCSAYAKMGYFVGISALPTDGSADTQMKTFMQETLYNLFLDDKSIVYRVGDTAFAYENKNTKELVIWDRETETRQTIGVGAEIENWIDSSHIGFLEDRKYQSACFQANTVNGTYYIPYDEKNPTKAWNEYSTTPIEKTEKLDAYYQLLIDKLKNR